VVALKPRLASQPRALAQRTVSESP